MLWLYHVQDTLGTGFGSRFRIWQCMKLVQHYLILPQHLNHMGTLFGGIAMSLSDEVAFLCASLAYPSAAFVTKVFEPFNFAAPAHLGDILKISAEIVATGNTSVTLALEGRNARSGILIFATRAVFVNAPGGAKAPLPVID